ncbi:MAG: hypothetical protein AB7N76_17835 [Planctomycetota bacterium]
MRWLLEGLWVLVLTASIGCASLEQAGLLYTGATHPAVVSVEGDLRGRGAAIDETHVVTVAHVVGARREVRVALSPLHETTARVVGTLPGSAEPLVVLELQRTDGVWGQLFGFQGFAPAQRFTRGAGEPERVIGQRGPVAWVDGALRPGDSGSPVLDRAGRLIGLVSGRMGEIPIASYLPSGELAVQP